MIYNSDPDRPAVVSIAGRTKERETPMLQVRRSVVSVANGEARGLAWSIRFVASALKEHLRFSFLRFSFSIVSVVVGGRGVRSPGCALPAQPRSPIVNWTSQSRVIAADAGQARSF